MTPQAEPSKQSTAQLIWDAIVDLQNAERNISRKVISDATGLKKTIVDDHVDRLVANERLRMIGAGLLEVVEMFPPALPISKTVLSNGLVKLERGDECWSLSPKEARTIGDLFKGEMAALYEIESGNKALVRTVELASELRKVRLEVAALKEKRGHPGQLELTGVGAPPL